MPVIGLCGPAGAGKTTVAKMLQFERGARLLPFAAPLKKMLEALGVPRLNLYGTPADKAKPLGILGGKSARFAMQKLGTEWGREHFGADFWCNAWAAALELTPRGVLIVADDVRFPSEVDAVKRAGGLVLCVVRSSDDFEKVPAHPSEDFARLGYDATLYNDGDVEALRRKVREIGGVTAS